MSLQGSSTSRPSGQRPGARDVLRAFPTLSQPGPGFGLGSRVYIGIMEKNMETTMMGFRVYTWTMDKTVETPIMGFNKMETTMMGFRVYTWTIDKTVETTIMGV